MNIQKLSQGRYKVPSATKPGTSYLVKYIARENHWTCDCDSGNNRDDENCWHVKAVKLLELQKK